MGFSGALLGERELNDGRELLAGRFGLRGRERCRDRRPLHTHAFPEEGVDTLVSFMREFERKHG